MDDYEAMGAALKEADAALEQGEVPVGAVILQNGCIVAAAHNRREEWTDPTAHAEMIAMREAARVLGRRRLQSCTLYVTLEPCPMCAGAALAAQLGRIVFGAPDPEKGCCGSVYALPEDPALDGTIPCDGPLRCEESRERLTCFFEQHRDKKAP